MVINLTPAVNRKKPVFRGGTNSKISNRSREALENRVLFLSDLDGTWLCDKKEARNRLDTGVIQLKKACKKEGIDFQFGYVTGRPPERIDKSLPKPDWTITYNGASILKGVWNKSYSNWEDKQANSGFNAKIVKDAIKELNGSDKYKNLTIQPMSKILNSDCVNASKYTQPFCIKNDSIKLLDGESKDLFNEESYRTPEQVENFVNELKGSLNEKGIKYYITDPYLAKKLSEPSIVIDVSSPLANKGEAVEFLRKELDVKPENLILAADGGNDISMMKNDGRRIIVVGPNSPLRRDASQLNRDKIFMMSIEDPSSLAVFKGLDLHLSQVREQIKKQEKQPESKKLDLSA